MLDVVQSEHLQQQARRVGDYLKKRLLALKQKYPLIGDVRGSGLFLGLDLVLDPVTRAPAPRQAEYVVNRLRECGILTGTDGPHHNVIKLRPPLIITESDADIFTDALTNIQSEDSAQPVTVSRIVSTCVVDNKIILRLTLVRDGARGIPLLARAGSHTWAGVPLVCPAAAQIWLA